MVRIGSPLSGDGIHGYCGDGGDIQGSSCHDNDQTLRCSGLSANLIGTSLALAVEALAGERGNRTTTFNENRQTRQTNRGGIDTNNRFPNREEAINNRTDRVTDRQDGRNHRVDSRQ